MPWRLVDTGVSGDYSDVQLASSANIRGDAVYVALRHCWGKMPMMTWKIESQIGFEAAIPFQSLPQTFNFQRCN
jgi:hypothetical protein